MESTIVNRNMNLRLCLDLTFTKPFFFLFIKKEHPVPRFSPMAPHVALCRWPSDRKP